MVCGGGWGGMENMPSLLQLKGKEKLWHIAFKDLVCVYSQGYTFNAWALALLSLKSPLSNGVLPVSRFPQYLIKAWVSLTGIFLYYWGILKGFNMNVFHVRQALSQRASIYQCLWFQQGRPCLCFRKLFLYDAFGDLAIPLYDTGPLARSLTRYPIWVISSGSGWGFFRLFPPMYV